MKVADRDNTVLLAWWHREEKNGLKFNAKEIQSRGSAYKEPYSCSPFLNYMLMSSARNVWRERCIFSVLIPACFK